MQTQQLKQRVRISVQRRIFLYANLVFLLIFAFICIFPFINLLAISLSSSEAVDAGSVSIFPKNITFAAYDYLLSQKAFFNALLMSVVRVVSGTVLSMVVMILAAYPLSKTKEKFPFRKFYTIYFIITMFFSGGIVPMFLLISQLKIRNTIFALILPMAMNAWYMVLLVNFFRQVPKEMEEAASIEGAGHYRILLSVVLPVSLPAIATVTLFTAISHWNAWFDGSLYMNPSKVPLQSYIYNIIAEANELRGKANLSPEQQAQLNSLPTKTLMSAQIFVAILPIVIIYPLCQKFFIKGLVVGSVKG